MPATIVGFDAKFSFLITKVREREWRNVTITHKNDLIRIIMPPAETAKLFNPNYYKETK